MTETTRRTIKRRTEAHTDVPDTPPFRQRLEGLTRQEFGRALFDEVRAARDGLAVRNLSEEWLKSGEGLIYEISAEVEPLPE